MHGELYETETDGDYYLWERVSLHDLVAGDKFIFTLNNAVSILSVTDIEAFPPDKPDGTWVFALSYTSDWIGHGSVTRNIQKTVSGYRLLPELAEGAEDEAKTKLKEMLDG